MGKYWNQEEMEHMSDEIARQVDEEGYDDDDDIDWNYCYPDEEED